MIGKGQMILPANGSGIFSPIYIDNLVDGMVLAIAAKDPATLDIFAVADQLSTAGGWYLDRQSQPDALHLTVHAGSAASVSSFLEDLPRAVAAVDGATARGAETPYAVDQ